MESLGSLPPERRRIDLVRQRHQVLSFIQQIEEPGEGGIQGVDLVPFRTRPRLQHEIHEGTLEGTDAQAQAGNVLGAL